ncbi:MAG: hypothetical protein ACFFDT_10025 [Candidatus Hodarchaeota archaeon]
MQTLQEVVQQEMSKMEAQRNSLMEHPKIRPFLRAAAKWVEKTQNRPITLYEKRNIAQCLYNAIIESGIRQNSVHLKEATTEDSISFLGIQLPVISALLPTLVLNEIAIVQAIDRRIAAVFYLDVLYGSAKGEVAAKDVMIGAKTGHAVGQSERQYAIARVERENIGTGNGTKSAVATATAPGLINLQNVKVESKVGTTYTTLGTSDESGNITGTYANGTINASGAYTIVISGVASAAVILLSYDYQYDLPTDVYGNRDGVPETEIKLTQSPVEAIDFPLRAKWSLGAQYDLQKAHGMDLESELNTFMGGEIRFTIDQKGLDEIDKAAESVDAATQVTDWDARPSQGEAWFHKKVEFLDRIEQGSNAIFAKTKRGIATFMVCGNNVARVIKQLGRDYFVPAAGLRTVAPTGPIKIGVLNEQVTVIQNPFKSVDRYTLGYRGPDYLHAGFIYCPYIPLFATPTITTSDLMSQKGYMSSAAFKTINAGLFTYGDIKNLQQGYVLGS